MNCPKCDVRLKVIDTVNIKEDGEVYRLRECPICKKRMYTVEFEVDATETFMNKFHKNHRA